MSEAKEIIPTVQEHKTEEPEEEEEEKKSMDIQEPQESKEDDEKRALELIENWDYEVDMGHLKYRIHELTELLPEANISCKKLLALFDKAHITQKDVRNFVF